MSTATMVPVIIFSLLFGAALNVYIARTGNRLVLGFFDQLQQIVLTMIRLVMYIAPIGVFCLLAALTGDVRFAVVDDGAEPSRDDAARRGDPARPVRRRRRAAHAAEPVEAAAQLAEQTAIAVTTTSSAVTFPTVLRNAVEKVGISKRVASFTLSVGLTMGSYGAVLNYTIVVLFLAQAGDVDLSPGQLVLGMALAVLLNMGTITVPGGFPVVAMFLATSLGLPFEAVGLLIAVDWFTGMLPDVPQRQRGPPSSRCSSRARATRFDRDVYDGRKTVTASDEDAAAGEALDETGGEATDDSVAEPVAGFR